MTVKQNFQNQTYLKKKKFDDSNRVIKRRKLEDSQYYDGEKMTNIDLKNITQTTKD
jgi:hypothetical protein